MFANEQIIYQPAFYFFIAATIVLSVAFRWGRKANQAIIHRTFKPLLSILKGRDQQYTNIGGSTGYHIRFKPTALRIVGEVTGTLTLLPRHSLLYLPIPLLTGRRDKLVLSFDFNKKGNKIAGEAHLVTPRQLRRPHSAVDNAELTRRELQWGELSYLGFWGNEDSQANMQRLIGLLGDPTSLEHVAIVPSQSRVWLVITPRKNAVARIIAAVATWLDEIA